MMNEVNLSGLQDASWFAIVTPMAFGMPVFDPVSILTMTAVLIIVFIVEWACSSPSGKLSVINCLRKILSADCALMA